MQQSPWARKPARRRTGLHTLLALVLVAVAAGATYLAVVQVPKWLRGPDAVATDAPSPSVSTLDPLPGCRSPGFPDFRSLGDVAWVESGALRVVNLPTCRQKVLAPTGAETPVRFSADGRWVAYGGLSYVRSTGGKPVTIASGTHSWAWSPHGARLAFITKNGGVSVAQPGGKTQAIFAPSAGKAGHVLWSPDGTVVAIDLPGRIATVDVHTFVTHTVYQTSGPSPEIAAWTPDSKWILFWSRPLTKDARKQGGRALNTIPAGGGDWRNVWDSMLPYRDLLSPCGRDVVISGGGRPELSDGKQVLRTGPPDWRFHNLTNDYIRSWAWPACSPDARWLAATSMANGQESKFSSSIRALWVIRTDTGRRTKIEPSGFGAYETARWARDGKTLLVVFRSQNDWTAPGTLALIEVDPATGKDLQVADLGIDVGSAPGVGGHQRWSEVTDWYRPPLAAGSTPSPSSGSTPPPASPT
jgi:dipeptidyl aminopeptidase/acylaminoacyl peptidase